MARKKPGAYAPLSAHYADDDRIMAAGEEAELLYLRALAYCARTPKTEGHLTFAQVRFRLGLDGAEERAEKCAEVGLLERTDSGYRIASWLKWNLSAEEVERVRTQDRHRKGKPVTSAKSGNGSGKATGSAGVKSPGIRVPYTETDTDTETLLTPEVADAPSGDDDTDDVPSVFDDRPDIERVCQHLVRRMVENGYKRPAVTNRWRMAAKQMLDTDKRSEQQIIAAIDWAHDNDFWRANIKSVPTLRKQYDTLRLQAERERNRQLHNNPADAHVARYLSGEVS